MILSSCVYSPVLAQQTTGTSESPSQAYQGDIRGTVVTLYYYDPVTGMKGEKAPLPDNPQEVQWDPARAAPGSYTFTRVPEGHYYVEAVTPDNDSYFAIVEVSRGTSTANVAIPGWKKADDRQSSLPVSVTPEPVATPAYDGGNATAGTDPTPRASPGPGMAMAAIAMLAAIILYIKR